MYENNLLTLSSCTMNLNFAFSPFLVSQRQPFSSHKRNLHTLVAVSANSDNLAGEDNGGISAANKGSGTTARGRRLLKVREEKRKRDYDRLHDYPSWAKYLFLSFSFALQVFVFLPKSRESVNLFLVNDKCRVLESACKDDEELRAVLGDSIGNPELMRKKVIVGSNSLKRILVSVIVSLVVTIWHALGHLYVLFLSIVKFGHVYVY
jgi:hypothetical protein